MKYLFFLLICFLTGCSVDSPEVAGFSGNAMTIDYRLLIGKKISDADREQIHAIITATFSEVDRIYNKWNPQSEISKLNQLQNQTVVRISPQLERLLLFTQDMVEMTEGRFDPTVEPMFALWKEKLDQGTLPSAEEIDLLSPAIGWKNIHLSQGAFYKDHDRTGLDLGGIAKGWAVDQLVENLQAAGYSDLFVEWGGEIRAAGMHPDHRPWNIFISRLGDPDPQHAIAQLSLSDQAIATSGDYLQYWTISSDGSTKVYAHIMDPHKFSPLLVDGRTVASASVIASTCALADGLATAAMTFPTVYEAQVWAENLRKHNPGLAFWIVSRESEQK